MTKNTTVLKWLEEMKELLNPAEVVWIDGSEEQLEEIRRLSVATGEMMKLNEEKLPGCYLHRTILTMLHVLRTVPSFAQQKERMQAPQITGAHPKRCMKSFIISLEDATREKQCMLFLIQWAP